MKMEKLMKELKEGIAAYCSRCMFFKRIGKDAPEPKAVMRTLAKIKEQIDDVIYDADGVVENILSLLLEYCQELGDRCPYGMPLECQPGIDAILEQSGIGDILDYISESLADMRSCCRCIDPEFGQPDIIEVNILIENTLRHQDWIRGIRF